MATPIDNLLKGATETVKGIHESPALMLASDISLIKNLLPSLTKTDQQVLEELRDLKDLSLLQTDKFNQMLDVLKHLAVLPEQIQSVELYLQQLNNTMGRLLHLQEHGSTRILETTGKTIAGGRKTDLFKGYDESGRLQSVLLDFSHDSVEGYIVLDHGRIEFNFEDLKQMNAFNPSGREWWISRYDDTNDHYVLQFTPTDPLPFDKRCWVRIWNRSTNALDINVGRMVKQVTPIEQTDIKAQLYGRDVQLARSKRLQEEIGLKQAGNEGEVF